MSLACSIEEKIWKLPRFGVVSRLNFSIMPTVRIFVAEWCRDLWEKFVERHSSRCHHGVGMHNTPENMFLNSFSWQRNINTLSSLQDRKYTSQTSLLFGTLSCGRYTSHSQNGKGYPLTSNIRSILSLSLELSGWILLQRSQYRKLCRGLMPGLFSHRKAQFP